MTFLQEPAPSDGQRALYDEDIDDDGYVWDSSRLWGHQAELYSDLMELWSKAADAAGLSMRDKAMLVLGQSRTIGDSLCSYAWARVVSEVADPETALAAITDDERPFTERERALSRWAHGIAGDPNGTTSSDIDRLREAGFDDRQILALTLYAALRIALSTTNDALGTRPDMALAETLDPPLRAAITWGRPPE